MVEARRLHSRHGRPRTRQRRPDFSLMDGVTGVEARTIRAPARGQHCTVRKCRQVQERARERHRSGGLPGGRCTSHVQHESSFCGGPSVAAVSGGSRLHDLAGRKHHRTSAVYGNRIHRHPFLSGEVQRLRRSRHLRRACRDDTSVRQDENERIHWQWIRCSSERRPLICRGIVNFRSRGDVIQ